MIMHASQTRGKNMLGTSLGLNPNHGMNNKQSSGNHN